MRWLSPTQDTWLGLDQHTGVLLALKQLRLVLGVELRVELGVELGVEGGARYLKQAQVLVVLVWSLQSQGACSDWLSLQFLAQNSCIVQS